MPEFTRPAMWDDVKLLPRYFDGAGVEYAGIGGCALAAHDQADAEAIRQALERLNRK